MHSIRLFFGTIAFLLIGCGENVAGLLFVGCGGSVEVHGSSSGGGGAAASTSVTSAESGVGGAPIDGGPEPDGTAPDDAACQHLPTPVRCNDPKRTAVCAAAGGQTIAICYAVPGPNPLLPISADQFPTYGCSAPSSPNSGAGDLWMFWCCSTTTPGPIDDGCGGTCVDLSCLP